MEDRERRRRRNRKYYIKRKAHQTGLPERRVLVSSRVPEWMLSRLQLVASEGLVRGTYPCKTMSEAIQYVLKLGLSAMKDDPDIGDNMKYVEAKNKIHTLRQSRKDGIGLLNDACEEVVELIKAGDPNEALRCFHLALEAMRDVPPTIWGDKAIAQFKAKFPELAKLEKKGKIPARDFIARGLRYGKRMDDKEDKDPTYVDKYPHED